MSSFPDWNPNIVSLEIFYVIQLPQIVSPILCQTAQFSRENYPFTKKFLKMTSIKQQMYGNLLFLLANYVRGLPDVGWKMSVRSLIHNMNFHNAPVPRKYIIDKVSCEQAPLFIDMCYSLENLRTRLIWLIYLRRPTSTKMESSLRRNFQFSSECPTSSYILNHSQLSAISLTVSTQM
ncbi:unnamed protein product [Caenorhabditis nigoni]